MAEIHVQEKKTGSSTWLWILISVIIVAALGFIFIWNNYNERKASSETTQVSSIQYHSLPAS